MLKTTFYYLKKLLIYRTQGAYGIIYTCAKGKIGTEDRRKNIKIIIVVNGDSFNYVTASFLLIAYTKILL